MVAKYWHRFWSLFDKVMEQLQANDNIIYFLSKTVKIKHLLTIILFRYMTVEYNKVNNYIIFKDMNNSNIYLCFISYNY